MSEKIPVREIGGIKIGEKGDPNEPFVRALREQGGISIHPVSIRHWRSGGRQAGRTRRRVEIPQIILKEGSARKNVQLLHVIETALEEKENRLNNPAMIPNSRYGLADSVAEKLHVPPGEINIIFRLMRADICLAKDVPEAITSSFLEAVEEFTSNHPLGSNRESPLTRKLYDRKWDGSMKGFYEVLDSVGPPAVKVWILHELEMFKAWYLYQQESGNLTTFDEVVLENWRKYNLRLLSKEMNSLTGVSLDGSALAVHVRVLDGTFLPKTS